MKVFTLCAALAALSLATPAFARPRHQHRGAATAFASDGARSEEPYAGLSHNPYAGYSGPGSEVLNATVRAEREPGVTLELAPDAKETATGGPVGGPPGFDGS